MSDVQTADHVRRIDPAEPFTFDCHRDIDCFTRCCRQLELALTPYDVLRLRYATGLASADLLERYVIIEQSDEDAFPHCYLSMVDDGNDSCVFLKDSGCSVYRHRPSACRTYPLGRATIRAADRLDEFFVLLHEPHCHGFRERLVNTTTSYLESQGLAPYHLFNDRLAEITQHDRIRQGMRLTQEQSRAYILALYDLDSFRPLVLAGNYGPVDAPATLRENDEALLDFSLRWLMQQLFDMMPCPPPPTLEWPK